MAIMSKPGNLTLIALIALSALFSTYQVYMELHDISVSMQLVNVWNITFCILIAIWAIQDSKSINIPRRSSYGLIMLVIWPILLLYHLASSRGIEGVVIYIGAWALYLAPFFLGLTAYSYG